MAKDCSLLRRFCGHFLILLVALFLILRATSSAKILSGNCERGEGKRQREKKTFVELNASVLRQQMNLCEIQILAKYQTFMQIKTLLHFKLKLFLCYSDNSQFCSSP